MDASAARHRRLRELFHEAVELPPKERDAFLDGLGGSDVEVVPELRRLLAADAEPDFVAEGLAAQHRELAQEVGASLVGRRLGPYRLIRLLGRGGMGAVYLGERADDLFRQEVAIKLLRPELASPELVRRFGAERQTLASLSHPNIARLLDGGTTEDGLPFLVMEYIEGVTLEEHCDANDLGVDARLALFMTVCSAVEEAHRNLVVHRDIKPANILVTADGTVKLLDFGIAKLLEDGGEKTQVLTRAERYGTLGFASPEQVSGGTITTGTDVYALGVLLYRMLTGRHPYDLEGKPEPEAARIICQGTPLAPSKALLSGRAPPAWARDAERLARTLEGDLDQIMLLALRKEPARRYASVAELSEDVRRYLEHRPVAARPDTLLYRFEKFVGRHRAGVAAATLALLALFGGLAAFVRQARLTQAERVKAQHVSTFLKQTLSSADPVRGNGRKVTVAEVLDQASLRLSGDLAGQPEVEASLRETLGDTYLSLGLSKEAEREFRRELKLAGPGPDESTGRAGLGEALSDQGRWKDAEAELRRALELCRAMPERSLSCVGALNSLTVALQNQGRAKEGAVAGREALAALRRSFPQEKLMLASVLNDLGICEGNQGNLREAEGLHREAVAAALAARGERHPITAEAMANLAGIMDMEGRTAEAEPIYRRVLEIQEAVIGERHFDFIRTLTSYANVLLTLGRPAEAEPYARRARTLALAFLGAEHPLTSYAETTLGNVLLETGKAADAEPYLRRALATRRKSLPAGHWLIASAQSNLGAALFKQGEYTDAERELLEAYATLSESGAAGREKSLVTAGRLAQLYSALGKADEARRYRELATPSPAAR